MEITSKTGLRDVRHVIFDGGKRMVWLTTFETDWDPYIEDAFVVIGIDNFTDWMQHTTADGRCMRGSVRPAGTRHSAAGEALSTDPDREKAVRMRPRRAQEDLVVTVQIPATGYYNAVSYLTHAEIRKAQRVYEAFQQVLDDPDAAEALQHPALKPLLEQAAD